MCAHQKGDRLLATDSKVDVRLLLTQNSIADSQQHTLLMQMPLGCLDMSSTFIEVSQGCVVLASDSRLDLQMFGSLLQHTCQLRAGCFYASC